MKKLTWYKRAVMIINKSWCERMGTWISILIGLGTLMGFLFSMFIKQYDYNKTTESNKADISSIMQDMKYVREDINNLKIIASNTSKSLEIIQKIVLSWDETYGDADDRKLLAKTTER